MKKIIIALISIFLISCSNDIEKEQKTNYLDENIEVASYFVKKDILEYTTEKFQILNDSLENTSGFIGWRNIRDYIHLGDETMNEKVSRIWKGVYKVEEVSNIINIHINDLASSMSLNSSKFNIKLKYDNYIENYSHKIGLSFGLMIIEFAIEGIISYGIAFVISFVIAFIAMRLFGIDLSTSSIILKIVVAITFIVFFILSLKTDSLSQKKLKVHVVNEITNSTMEVVNEKFEEINSEFYKIKSAK